MLKASSKKNRTALSLMIATGVLTLFILSAWGAEESVDDWTQTALSLDTHPEHGRSLYRQRCAPCHGLDAQGNASRTIPALASQRYAYVIRQLANFSGDERDSTAMHRVVAGESMRNPQAWADLAGYLNKLPMLHTAEVGNGTDLQFGRRLFQEHCASCHYGDAHGDADGFVPSLRNQHYGYLVTQLHQLAQRARHNVDPELLLFIRDLSNGEICAVADYLSRLHGPGRNSKSMRSDGTVVD